MLRSTETVSATKFAMEGAVCVSGVKTTILGPTRVDPYFDKSFSAFNHSAAPLTVNIEVNLDPHGSTAGQFVAGSQAAIPPNPAYWSSVGSMVVPASGVAFTTDKTPALWVRLTTVATLGGTTVSGFMHALTM